MTTRRVHSAQRTSTRRRHRGQGGVTLIELLVSISILAVIGVAVSTVFAAGLKSLGSGGAGDRLTGARDVSVFGQQLGADVTRASCISAAPFTLVYGSGAPQGLPACGTAIPGTASPGYAASHCKAIDHGAFLCVAWPQLTDSTCHVAVYGQSGGATNVVTRYEWSIAPATGQWSGAQVTHLTLDHVAAAAAAPGTGTAPPGYQWPGTLSLTVASTGVTFNAPNATFVFHPLSSDPASGYQLC